MKKILATLCVVAICSATSAIAYDTKTMNEDHIKAMVDKHMKMMDTNNDGMVSKEEFTTAMDKKFTEMDKNNDGMLTKQEILDGKMMEMQNMGMDKDKMMNDKK